MAKISHLNLLANKPWKAGY